MGNQLIRYAESLKDEFKPEHISLVYFKTGDQSNYNIVKEKGYRVYKRYDFLKLLQRGKKEGITNNIYCDFFLDYTNNLDILVNSYKNLPINEWGLG